MDKHLVFIMDQIEEAKQRASAYGRTVYCYLQDGQWYLSGKMPLEASQYYVVYPDGDTDQSPNSPKITDGHWAEFHKQTAVNANYWPSGQKAKAPVCTWTSFWRFLLCYCAFAPHASLALTMTLSKLVAISSASFWNLAFVSAILCLPFSILFALTPLYKPKSGAIATISSMLASDGHMLLYAHLYLLSVTGDEEWLVVSLMASLMASSIAYLLLMDNRSSDQKAMSPSGSAA